MASKYERMSLRDMSGYVPGEQPEHADVVKLNTNENPYPPPAAVREALAGFDVTDLRRYPSADSRLLREAAAGLHGVDPDQVMFANGGDEVLRLAVTAFVDAGDVVAWAEPSYSLYPVLADIQDARHCTVPLADDYSLPANFAAQVNEAEARLTFVVNPHAPSGRLLDAPTIDRLAAAVDGVLLVDEAYVDFVDPRHGHDLVPLVARHDNLLLLRTLSKGYSLAGLRAGYAIGQAELLAPMTGKVRDSYNVDGVTQALALAALGAQDEVRANCARVIEHRQRLGGDLAQLGLDPRESETNFLLVTVPAGLRLDARSLQAALAERHIYVRYFALPGLDDKLRISVGLPEENARLLAALAELLVS